MNPDEIVKHLSNVKGTYSAIRENDSTTEQIVQALTKQFLVGDQQKLALSIFKDVGIEEEFLRKIGYDLENKMTTQDRLFDGINNKLKQINDVDSISPEELLKIFTEDDIIEDFDDSNLRSLPKFIYTLTKEEFVQIKGYFLMLVEHDFDNAIEVIKKSKLSGNDSIIMDIMKLINSRTMQINT